MTDKQLMEKLNQCSVRWLRENFFNNSDIEVNKLLDDSKKFDYIKDKFDELSSTDTELKTKIKELVQIDLGTILLLKIGNPSDLETEAATFSLNGNLTKPYSFNNNYNSIEKFIKNDILSYKTNIGFTIIELSAKEPLRYDVILKLLLGLYGYYERKREQSKNNDDEKRRICLVLNHLNDEQMRMIKGFAETINIKVVEKDSDIKWREEIAKLLAEIGYDAEYTVSPNSESLKLKEIEEIEKIINYINTFKNMCNKYLTPLNTPNDKEERTQLKRCMERLGILEGYVTNLNLSLSKGEIHLEDNILYKNVLKELDELKNIADYEEEVPR